MKLKLFTVSLLAVLSCSASIITYVGPVSGANDGQFFTGPVNLLVDGNPVIAACLNFDVAAAATWVGTVVPLSDIPVVDRLPFLEAEWLFQQFDVNGQGLWPNIQHGIWDLFGGSYADGVSWDNLALANYLSINPSLAAVIIPDPKLSSQEFIGLVTSAPEPVTMGMMGLGLIAVSLLMRKRKV